MSILVFLNAFWNKGKTIGGGDQTIIQVLRQLQQNFSRLVFVTAKSGEQFVRQNIAQAEFIASPAWFNSLGISLSYVLRTKYALFNAKLWQEYDALYVSSDFFPDVVPAFILKILKPKINWVQHIHHLYPKYKTRVGKKLKNLLAQKLQIFSLKLIKKSDIVIVPSDSLKNILVNQFSFKKQKICVIANGINLNYFLNLKPSNVQVNYEATFLGRLHPTKGIFDLIEIWSRVMQEIPNAKLAIIGGGDEKIKYELQTEIKKNNFQKNIDLLGFLPDDQAFSIIKNSTVFILPSHEEGFGRVIIEAMACHTPVIAWNLPVFPEIFKDKIIQVQENNFQEFAMQIIELIQDKEKRNKLSEDGLEFVKKFDWEKLAPKYLCALKH